MISFDLTKKVVEFLPKEDRDSLVVKRAESQIRVGSIEEAFKTISLLDVDDPKIQVLYEKIGLAVHRHLYSATSDTALETFSKINILPQNAMRHICVTDFFCHILCLDPDFALTIPKKLDPISDRVSLGAIAIRLASNGDHERAVQVALSIRKDPYRDAWQVQFDSNYYLQEICENYLKEEPISFDKVRDTLTHIENSPSRDALVVDFVTVLCRARRVDEASSWALQISDSYYKENAEKLLKR